MNERCGPATALSAMRGDGAATGPSVHPPFMVIMLRTGPWRLATKIKLFAALLVTLALLQYFFGSSVYHVDYNMFQYYWSPADPASLPVVDDAADDVDRVVDHRTVAILIAESEDSLFAGKNSSATNDTSVSTAVELSGTSPMKPQPADLELCPLVPPVLGERLFLSSQRFNV